jgi:hypothetical protein
MKTDRDPRPVIGQYLAEDRRRALEEARGAEYADAYADGYEVAYHAGYEAGLRAGSAEALDVVRRYARQLVREKVGLLTPAHDRVIDGLNDVCALADLIVEVVGVGEPAELDALFARLTSVARAPRRRPVMLKGHQYQSTFARSYVAEGRSQEFRDVRRAAIDVARSKAPDVEGILFERIEQIDTIPRLVELIAAIGAARTRDEVRTVLEGLPAFT